jgi:hypothetical protein
MSAHGTEPNTEPLLFPDPVIEAYIKDIDRTLIRQQLRKSVAERLRDLEAMAEAYEAGRRMRARERQANERRAVA